MAKESKLVVVGGKAPQMRKAGKRAWTREKEQVFVSALAETCNVTRACAEAGVSSSAAYQRRKADAAFRAAWREAIGIAYHRLELVLLDRAFNGTERTITRKDGSEERMREYPNQLGVTLLKMHRETAMEAAPENEPDNIEESRERLFNKLERLRKREESRGSAG